MSMTSDDRSDEVLRALYDAAAPFVRRETDPVALAAAISRAAVVLLEGLARGDEERDRRHKFYGALGARVAAYERDIIEQALEAAGGSVVAAVALLGLGSRQALYKKLKRHGLTLDRPDAT